MQKTYDVSSVCNALVDIILEAKDEDLVALNLTKGVMHLVDEQRQQELLDYFHRETKAIELGGSSLNAIRSLASLGKKTFFSGMVAKDEFGEKIKERLDWLKIASKLSYTDRSATGICLVLVTPDGERTMNTFLGASRLYDPETIPLEAVANSRIFHFCGYQWDTDDQKSAIEHAIECAKRNNTLVSFDVADPFIVKRNKNDFLRLIKESADIVFANAEEAKILFDTQTGEESAKAFSSYSCVYGLKLGSKGALVGKKNEQVIVSAVATTVVDTTAAGDMFAAGFLSAYIDNKSLEECGRVAAILASDVISRFGATISDEVVRKLKKEGGLGGAQLVLEKTA